MKIISGIHKGYRLPSPKSSETRPTQEKVRAQIFNICQGEVEEAIVLDIFAGSGSLGFEAISRGAKSCTFIEKDRRQAELISQVISEWHADAEVLVLDARRGIEFLKKRVEKGAPRFTLCLSDPPYSQTTPQNMKLVVETLIALDEANILANNCRVFVEDSLKSEIDTLELTHLKLENARRSGSTCLREFRFIETPQSPLP